MNAKTNKFIADWLERSVDFNGKNIQLKRIFAKQNDFEAKCLICPAVINVMFDIGKDIPH